MSMGVFGSGHGHSSFWVVGGGGEKTAIGQMAVGVADDAGRLVCDLEDREIPIGFAGGRAGVAGRRDLQSISCSSSRSKAAVLQEGCGSEKKGTKDAEQEESSVNGR